MTELQLANSLPDAVFILDQNANLEWWNLAATQLFPLVKLNKQLTPAVLVGKEAFARCWPNNEELFETKLSTHKHVTYCLKPYTQTKQLFIVQDISRTKHLERMRQDFVANVSHELRTPLTVIHGFLELLTEQAEQQRPILEQMLQQSTRMQNIIDELLFLSRLENVEHSTEDFTKVNVTDLLIRIIDDAKELSQNNHQFELNIDSNLPFTGVAEELRSLFSNLIFNAVKYTPTQGQITIRWYRNGHHAIFEVQDTGIGIEKKHLPRLTERFYRVDKARSSATGGTGLGLAIAKHILIHHHGNLTIDSKLNHGSTFHCEFPLYQVK